MIFFSFLRRNILLKEDYFMYMCDDTGVQRIIKKGIMYRGVTTLYPINSMMKFLLVKPQSQD